MDAFNTDEKCLQYIAGLKWADGWKCSRCGHKEYGFISTRHLIRCKNCNYEESFIVNTLMEKTHKPLRDWFWALYMIATQKTGMSAMELKRQMNFGSYETAWTWLQKIRMAMVNPDREKLRGEVEVDETYIQTGKAGKGRKLGGKKALIICAVEVQDTQDDEKTVSGRIRLRHIPNASSESIHSFIKDHIERGSVVKTDAWLGYTGLSRYGYKHIVTTIGDPKEASKHFPRVHRVFANLKAWLVGTHRYISTKHLQNYLNEYIFRFNRRNMPKVAFNSLIKIAILGSPRHYEGFTKPEKPYYLNPRKGG